MEGADCLSFRARRKIRYFVRLEGGKAHVSSSFVRFGRKKAVHLHGFGRSRAVRYKLRRIWASLISFSSELWMMLAKGPQSPARLSTEFWSQRRM